MKKQDFVVNLSNPRDTAQEIASKLNTLSFAVDASVIRGGVDKKDFDTLKDKTLKYIGGQKERIDMNDQRWHGGGLSAVVHDATLTGSGTQASPLSVVTSVATSSGTVTNVSVVTANGFQGTVASANTTPAISVNVDGTHYLPTTTDQTNWNGKSNASGTVISFSVATANGFGGSVSSATTTPRLTMTTSITGVLKGVGGALASATDGTDYLSGTLASSTYLPLSVATATYLPLSVATSTYLPLSVATATYLPLSVATATYLPLSVATATYLSIASASSTYITTGSTNTLTNKRITKRVLAIASGGAIPSYNTDNYDVIHIYGQSVAISSLTTGASGTPVDGDTLRISVLGTASVAITGGANFENSTVALPTTTSSTARLDIGFVWNTETAKWRVVATS